MVLKNVRLRTTFADMDSSNPSTSLATCEYYCHVLHKYSDVELRSVMDVAIGKMAWSPSSVIATYKEVQVHGEVKLSEHVYALVVSHMHKGDADMEGLLARFSSRHGVPIVWMAETANDRANRARVIARREAERKRREAEEKRRREEAERQRWDCWRCLVRNEGSSQSCVTCALGKPDTREAEAAHLTFECAACTVSNSATKRACATCGTVAPFWECRCSVSNPTCNVKCAVCSIPRPVPGASTADWICVCTTACPSYVDKCPVCNSDRPADAVLVEEWDCPACTCKNPGAATQCGTCHTARPGLTTGEPWHCLACTCENAGSARQCSVCGAARPPADATVGPPAPGPVAPVATWVCGACTFTNPEGRPSCTMCSTARVAPPPPPILPPPVAMATAVGHSGTVYPSAAAEAMSRLAPGVPTPASSAAPVEPALSAAEATRAASGAAAASPDVAPAAATTAPYVTPEVAPPGAASEVAFAASGVAAAPEVATDASEGTAASHGTPEAVHAHTDANDELL